jgi:hypothetical protein
MMDAGTTQDNNEYEKVGQELGGILGRAWSKIPYKVRIQAFTALVLAFVGWIGAKSTGISPVALVKAPVQIMERLDKVDRALVVLNRNQLTQTRLMEQAPWYDSAVAKVRQEDVENAIKAKRRRELFGEPLISPADTNFPITLEESSERWGSSN